MSFSYRSALTDAKQLHSSQIHYSADLYVCKTYLVLSREERVVTVYQQTNLSRLSA